METVNVVEAKKNFSELMAQVAYGGQQLVVERHGKPMMVWLSVEEFERLQQSNDDVKRLRTQRLAALEKATALRKQLLAERNGVPFSDSTELIYQMREDSMKHYDDLR